MSAKHNAEEALRGSWSPLWNLSLVRVWIVQLRVWKCRQRNLNAARNASFIHWNFVVKKVRELQDFRYGIQMIARSQTRLFSLSRFNILINL